MPKLRRGQSGFDRIAEILLGVLDRCEAQEAAERAARKENRREAVLDDFINSDEPTSDAAALSKKLAAVDGAPNGRRTPSAKRFR